MIHLRPHLFRPLAKLKIINDPFYPPFLFFLLERLSCGFFFPNYWDLLSIILFFISTLRHFSAAEATTFSFFLLEWARECLQFASFFFRHFPACVQMSPPSYYVDQDYLGKDRQDWICVFLTRFCSRTSR